MNKKPILDRLAKRYVKWLLLLRWPALIITVVVTGGLAGGLQTLKFSNDYRVFFDKDNPQLQALEELHKTYNDNDPLVFVITPKDGEVFSRQTLDSIEWLTREAWKIPHVQRVDSLQNFQYSRAVGDDLAVSDLFRNALDLHDPQLAEIGRIARTDPQLSGRIVSKSGKVTAVFTTFHLPGIDRQKEIPEIIDAAVKLKDELRNRNPNLELRLTGGIRMSQAFTDASNQDAATLTPLMFALIAAALAFFLRSTLTTLAALFLIAFTIAATMGIAGWLGILISPISAIAPNVLLTVAVADSVHVLVDFRSKLARLAARYPGRKRRIRFLAISQAVRQTVKPIFLTTLTTAIGFLTLNFSDSPPFHDLGNIVAIGVTLAFLLTIFFVPPLAAVLPITAGGNPKAAENGGFFAGLAEKLIRHRRWATVLVVSLVISLGIFLPSNELNDDMIKYFSHRTEFRTDWEYTTRNLTGLYPLEYSIRAKDAGGINDPEYLQAVERFARWFEAQPETQHVDSIVDIHKRLNKNMHGDDPEWYRLPETTELAAQYLLLYEMSLPPGLELNDRINIDKSATRFTVTVGNLSGNEMLDLERRATRWLEQNAPSHMRARAASPPLMFSHVGHSNIEGMIEGTVLEFAAIAAILMIMLRSVGLGLISLIPNVVPAVMAFGFWALVNGKINLGLSVVANMTLGIVVDDTVHFLSHYNDARRKSGLLPEAAILYTFRHVGKAMAVSTVVLAAGFGTLTLSAFELNAQMGLLTSITIVFALFGDLFLLPSLLLLKNPAAGLRVRGHKRSEGRPRETREANGRGR